MLQEIDFTLNLDGPTQIENLHSKQRQITLAFFYPWADTDRDNRFLKCCNQSVNQFVAWVTTDKNHPDKKFSHVELLLENNYSYSIRWGEKIHKECRRYTNAKCYGFLALYISSHQYQLLEELCESYVKNESAFNYRDNAFNFIGSRKSSQQTQHHRHFDHTHRQRTLHSQHRKSKSMSAPYKKTPFTLTYPAKPKPRTMKIDDINIIKGEPNVEDDGDRDSKNDENNIKDSNYEKEIVENTTSTSVYCFCPHILDRSTAFFSFESPTCLINASSDTTTIVSEDQVTTLEIKNKIFCSEFITDVLLQADVFNTDKHGFIDPSYTSPNSLWAFIMQQLGDKKLKGASMSTLNLGPHLNSLQGRNSV